MNQHQALDIDTSTPGVQFSGRPGYSRLFGVDQLSVGLILPLESHPDSPWPTMTDHVEMAQKAEALGFASLWLRDIPFFDRQYGDAGQIFEPLIYIAHLAAATTRIALGTTGIVLPFREPLMFAKQVNSVDHLASGRLVLGLSSGDRPSEYPAFGVDFRSRGEQFRSSFEVYRRVSERAFPTLRSPNIGVLDGTLDMLPKPLYGRVPALAVGRAQQSLAWIATNMEGYLGFVPEPALLEQFTREWRREVENQFGHEAFKPIGAGGFLYLHESPNRAFERVPGGFAIGSRALRHYLERSRDAGISHVALNPKITRRPYGEILDELASEVLPYLN
ncbi:TIGR03571 family LLM class oxidoreductase [Burkholderia anthina]|uniref:TIGR03571 family LLM class oxidoreductase n=1 Tax=Burkholderia anthina TaxID=179879 RepID=UPI00075AF581|nr:TIGR03571 family LLM class oxidoreductase [Burkholderia anthina]KVN53112.1 luciferase [Burkholderia anthina]